MKHTENNPRRNFLTKSSKLSLALGLASPILGSILQSVSANAESLPLDSIQQAINEKHLE